MIKNLGKQFSPMYFLASLGNGGLAVSFFIYLLFMVDHPKTPLATFEFISKALVEGGTVASILIALALSAIVYFSFKHFQLLIWNIREYRRFKLTEAYKQLKSSNQEVTLMAIPLTLAMSINVMFVLGAVFVPGLWNHVEYLFPFALLGFLAVGIYALKIFSENFTRFILKGELNFLENNHLGHMLAIFSFTMVGVGFAAPAAMSHHIPVSVAGMFGAIFFTSIAIMLAFIKMVLGFKSIFKQGLSKAASPSLWIMIPITTLVGITFVRLYAGVNHNLLHTEPSPVPLFIVLSILISFQMFFGLIGYVVQKQNGYFAQYIHGAEKHPGSFALICPGVASFVLGMFFLHWGLVKTHIIDQFSAAYFVMLIPFVAVQFKTIQVLMKLSRKIYASTNAPGQPVQVMKKGA